MHPWLRLREELHLRFLHSQGRTWGFHCSDLQIICYQHFWRIFKYSRCEGDFVCVQTSLACRTRKQIFPHSCFILQHCIVDRSISLVCYFLPLISATPTHNNKSRQSTRQIEPLSRSLTQKKYPAGSFHSSGRGDPFLFSFDFFLKLDWLENISQSWKCRVWMWEQRFTRLSAGGSLFCLRMLLHPCKSMLPTQPGLS